MKKRPTALVMSAEAHRGMALRWMMVGFDCSGRGFTGEAFDRRKIKNPKTRKALERILENYFNTVYEAKTKR